MIDTHSLELPAELQLEYLAEGGANVVYKILSCSEDSPILEAEGYGAGTPPPTEIEDPNLAQLLDGKLLRLRKVNAIPYEENVRNFDRLIRPLFSPDELVDQTLVLLPAGLVHRCNNQLYTDERNGKRPIKRHGVYLSTDEVFGLLVTDMTGGGDSGVTTAELKPKWLLQSPSAPNNSKRCRTCALREMRNHELRLKGIGEVRSFCPLDLVSEEFKDVLRATQFINPCHDRRHLAQFLYRNRTLLRLQEHQKTFNCVGFQGKEERFHSQSLAMSLRDCTMFIKVPYIAILLSFSIIHLSSYLLYRMRVTDGSRCLLVKTSLSRYV
jgi:inositol-pentakisphosphate 2-kinase